ncbi:hypothetical protein RBH26_02280 [Natronolimnohabitans sp. A-GB9]|uniref:hypothetical protein n=1 Tax=Natronolimnohabitans sp. A-GB9 TaxID=3069757 RepID=UPI0027B7226E|nr:hypothetical protein [Natronolimnohabitans sp. A-GB9]MDQ2049304.1 hypothetical protein [Natronolimnohabitans sp. A-GB9]
MLSPPSTLAEQRRHGYVLVVAAIVLAAVFTTVTVLDDRPLTRLLGVYLVAVVLAAVGLRAIVATRRGTLRVDETRRRAMFRAGHHAFWLLFIVIGTDSTFDLLGDDPASVYLLVGVTAYLVALGCFRRGADDR